MQGNGAVVGLIVFDDFHYLIELFNRGIVGV